MFTSIQKNKPCLLLVFLLITGCMQASTYYENIDIPSTWRTENIYTSEADPCCFRWWEAFDDPTLTALIEKVAKDNIDVRLAACESHEKLLQVVNKAAADTARSYIKLREAQNRLEIVEKNIEIQDRIRALEEDLAKKLLTTIDLNESKIQRYSLLEQKAAWELHIEKALNDLNLLLNDNYEECFQFGNLPAIPSEPPEEQPCELIARHPAVQEAKKIYLLAKNKQAFLNYKKTIFTVLNAVENSLSAVNYSIEKYDHVQAILKLRYESFVLKNELFEKGLKDEREGLAAYQQYLMAEDKFIEAKAEMLMRYVDLFEALSLGWEVCKR